MNKDRDGTLQEIEFGVKKSAEKLDAMYEHIDQKVKEPHGKAAKSSRKATA